MTRAVTFAITGEHFRLVHGPEVPVNQQVASFKRAISQPSSADSLEIWTSAGRIKRKKFAPSAPSVPVAIEPPSLDTEIIPAKKSKS